MSGGDRTGDGPIEPIPGVEAGRPQRLRSSYPGDPGGGGVGGRGDGGGAGEDLRHDLSSVGGRGPEPRHRLLQNNPDDRVVLGEDRVVLARRPAEEAVEVVESQPTRPAIERAG